MLKLVCAAYVLLNVEGAKIPKTNKSDQVVKRFEKKFDQCVSLVIYRESNGHFYIIPREPLK